MRNSPKKKGPRVMAHMDSAMHAELFFRHVDTSQPNAPLFAATTNGAAIVAAASLLCQATQTLGRV